MSYIEKHMGKLAAVILAAGKSTRMKSGVSKVMHPLCGRPLISYVIDAAKYAGAVPIVVVAPPFDKAVFDLAFASKVKVAVQKKALGTGHAVLQAKTFLNGSRHVLILCGDTPLIRGKTLAKFVNEVLVQKSVCALMTMDMKDPGMYGRVVRDLDGHVMGITEACDADEDELKLHEVNTGVFCAEKKWLIKTLNKIEPKNRKKEYYLTDIVHFAINEGQNVLGIKAASAWVGNPYEFLGVNTRSDLAKVGAIMRERINERHMISGVGIVDPANTYIDSHVKIGADTIVWPNAVLLGKTVIGSKCTIGSGVVLTDTVVAGGVNIKPYSVIEGSQISGGATIGPFSRIRPETKVGARARIGNFVEIKKSRIMAGVKANHLTYLGDAYVGANSNIGCGTITCNYDGRNKYRTIIGEKTFIGSDTQFVAPVRIGKGATIGAGSTITRNVPPGALALSRVRQVVVKKWKPKIKKEI